MSLPLSVVIITRNEETRLGDCVASAPFADEVLVVDSGSSDGTVALAESLGCRVIHQPWLGYGPQKRFAVTQAAHDWVLCLDADERVSAELAQSITRLLASSPAHGAYEMARCNRFMGRWLRHGEGYPDWSLRLFDRQRAQWSEDPVHEKVDSAGEVGRLDGDLLHHSEDGLDDYLHKQVAYSRAQAARQFANGRRGGVLRLLVSPLLRFFKYYFLRLGFLDGLPGLVHCAIGSLNGFMKYAMLESLRRGRSGST